MKKQTIKAVMFDLDGTVVDTEKIHQKFWPIAFKHFGYKMSKDDCLKLRSFGRPFVIEYLQKNLDPNIDYWTIRQYKNKHMAAYINKHGIKIKKGIVDLLKWLKANKIKVVLTTANTVDKGLLFLKKVKLYKYFDKIVSASDVKYGKPSPDTYILACKQVKLKPSNCIALEDSPNGVISAYKAGLNTVMIPDLTKPDKQLLKLNITVLDNAKEVIKYIQSINK